MGEAVSTSAASAGAPAHGPCRRRSSRSWWKVWPLIQSRSALPAARGLALHDELVDELGPLPLDRAQVDAVALPQPRRDPPVDVRVDGGVAAPHPPDHLRAPRRLHDGVPGERRQLRRRCAPGAAGPPAHAGRARRRRRRRSRQGSGVTCIASAGPHPADPLSLVWERGKRGCGIHRVLGSLTSTSCSLEDLLVSEPDHAQARGAELLAALLVPLRAAPS